MRQFTKENAEFDEGVTVDNPTDLVVPLWLPCLSKASSSSCPDTHWPNTTCLPSSQLVLAVVMKN